MSSIDKTKRCTCPHVKEDKSKKICKDHNLDENFEQKIDAYKGRQYKRQITAKAIPYQHVLFPDFK